MKKLLIATTAIAGFAAVSTPAMAQALELDLGGFYRGYGVFANNDLDGTTPGDTHDANWRHDAEIHFTGETTLDNGLTVGVHSEMNLATSDGTAYDSLTGELDQDEIYAYFSGQWGRVNVGQEDGAAYLLQVAAPSADSNVDGLRTYIQGYGTEGFDYAQDMGRNASKATYLTPKFGGFQAGVSYAPTVEVLSIGNGVGAMPDDDAGYEDLMEVAARWDGVFEGVGVSLGGGYGQMDSVDAALEDVDQWNIGANVQWTAFQFGAAYLDDDAGTGAESDAWTAGLGWVNGPYTAGLTYYDADMDTAGSMDRWTVGGTYSYGPGMTFRGTVALVDLETAADSDDFTQVTLGTEINF